jgi:hypothetical protein
MNKDQEEKQDEKKYHELLKPHLDGLFSGRYDLAIKNKDDDSTINLTEIVRLLVLHQREVSQKLLGIADLIKTSELPHKKGKEVMDTTE